MWIKHAAKHSGVLELFEDFWEMVSSIDRDILPAPTKSEMKFAFIWDTNNNYAAIYTLIRTKGIKFYWYDDNGVQRNRFIKVGESIAALKSDVENSIARIPTFDPRAAIKNVVKILRSGYENKFGIVFDRYLIGMDGIDDLILSGYTPKARRVFEQTGSNKGLWREHVVPCSFIIDRVLRMFRKGEKDDAIIGFIKRHLHIVMITKDEQQILDKRYKTRMPDDWSVGDSIFARLINALGISEDDIRFPNTRS